MITSKQLVALIGAIVMLSVTTAANAGSRPFMTRGAAVAAPTGFVDLCQRDESACGALAATGAGTASLAMTTLTTSSLSRALPMAAAASFERAKADAASDLARFEILEPYRPAPAEDFLPAGEARPVASAPMALAAGPAQLPANQMKLIERINREVNREVQKSDDFDLYGLLEFWSLPRVIDGKMYGDCEDYALEKRRRLIAAGVPAEALSMAVAVTSRGEGHAVLIVALESGDMVLDNLTPWATPWQDLNYRWVQRQVAGSAAWTTIS